MPIDKNFYNEASSAKLGWEPNWFGEKYFDDKLTRAIKKWQKENGLVVDGIVGPATLDCMGFVTTDNSEAQYETPNGLTVHRHMLPIGEYMTGSKPEYVFLHHTAGWHNPFRTVD